MDKRIKNYSLAIGLISVSILIIAIIIRPKPISFELSPVEKTLEHHRDKGVDKILEKEVKTDMQGQVQFLAKDGANSKREVIEGNSNNRPGEYSWRIVDNCKNPQAGVHVVCTPISPEIIQEWLNLEEDGIIPEPVFIETYTDSKGCFTFPTLESCCYLIRGDAPKRSPALGILDLQDGIPDEFEAIMVDEDIIRGVVLDCNQKPIHEATVYCYMAPAQRGQNMPLHCAGVVI
jgi:hypothetical protein